MNNAARNEEFVSTTMQVLAVLFIVVIYIWIYRTFLHFRNFSDDQFHLNLKATSFFVIVIVPTIIYIRKPNLRNHVYSRVKSAFNH